MSPLRKRAIYDEDKETRRREILAVAQKLFLKRGRLATATEVAARAGMAKGTVYLYFQTKEEIYLSYYEDLLHALLGRIQALCDDRTEGLSARIVDALCAFLGAHPEFLRLASLLNGVLEQNVSEEFILAYKTRIGTALVATATRLSEALPLSLDAAGRLLLQTYAMSVGLWQQADPPPVLRKLLSRHAELSFYQIDFATELRKALEILWLTTGL